MSRGHLAGVITALVLGAVAPRLAAQDTSTAGQARTDTSGYTAGGGVDTTARPGMVDSAGTPTPRQGADTMAAPGRADRDSTGALGPTDTSGMRGRHPDTTKVGQTSEAHPSGTSSDSASADSTADSASVTQPTKQPGQSTSRTGDSTSSTAP